MSSILTKSVMGCLFLLGSRFSSANAFRSNFHENNNQSLKLSDNFNDSYSPSEDTSVAERSDWFVKNEEQNAQFDDPYREIKNVKEWSVESIDSCQRKEYGVAPGYICKLDGDTYYLKSLSFFSFNILGWWHYSPYEIKFNSLLAKNHLGVKVPDFKVFYIPSLQDSPLLAAKKIDFIPAKSLAYKNLKAYRDSLINKIGNDGLAKLIVAMTFFEDLHNANYGFDNDGNLVLIDVDARTTFLEKDIINHDSDILFEFPFRKNIALSIEDIIEIKRIYTNIQKSPLPELPLSNAFTQEDFNMLLAIFIEACDKTIADLAESNYKNPTIGITRAFVNNILSAKAGKINMWIPSKRTMRPVKFIIISTFVFMMAIMAPKLSVPLINLYSYLIGKYKLIRQFKDSRKPNDHIV